MGLNQIYINKCNISWNLIDDNITRAQRGLKLRIWRPFLAIRFIPEARGWFSYSLSASIFVPQLATDSLSFTHHPASFMLATIQGRKIFPYKDSTKILYFAQTNQTTNHGRRYQRPTPQMEQ